MNRAWETYGPIGLCLGCMLMPLGLILQALEIARIYRGPANRDFVNFTNSDGYRPSELFGGDQFSTINQRHTMWPWSFPGIWLGILAFFTALMGCISARRRTYGSILGMAVLALVTFLLSTFVIAYYSIIINFYNSRRNVQFPYTQSQTLGRRLAGAGLAFSIFTMLASLLAACLGGGSIAMCTPKGRIAPRIPRGVPRFGPRVGPGYPPRFR
ncbi:hypothetical protein ACOME3_006632 [Neoechinorhynchus agilis]